MMHLLIKQLGNLQSLFLKLRQENQMKSFLFVNARMTNIWQLSVEKILLLMNKNQINFLFIKGFTQIMVKIILNFKIELF